MTRISELLLEQLLKQLEEVNVNECIDESIEIRRIIRKFNEEDGSLGALGTIPTPALGVVTTGSIPKKSKKYDDEDEDPDDLII
jgi:hypothetical protein